MFVTKVCSETEAITRCPPPVEWIQTKQSKKRHNKQQNYEPLPNVSPTILLYSVICVISDDVQLY